jgi:hypothetical protein
LKLVLEPIFEADFVPVSYGFRPMRRAHDAIAEIHQYGTQGYRWVLDADIEACFECGHLSWPRLGRGSSRILAPAGWVIALVVGAACRHEYWPHPGSDLHVVVVGVEVGNGTVESGTVRADPA